MYDIPKDVVGHCPVNKHQCSSKTVNIRIDMFRYVKEGGWEGGRGGGSEGWRQHWRKGRREGRKEVEGRVISGKEGVRDRGRMEGTEVVKVGGTE